MTPERLAEIRARCEAANRPVVVTVRKSGSICLSIGNPATGPHAQFDWHGFERDVQFYAHAVDDIPDLLAEVERLTAQRDELLAACKAVLDARELCASLDPVHNIDDELALVRRIVAYAEERP